jgi:flagellar biosynthesis/type III secretory pathway protein FliH
MGVLKPSVSRKHLQDAIALDLGDLRARADALCADARARAERIVEEAKAERERLLAGAHEEGFAAGKAEGHEKGLEEGRERGHKEALASHQQELARLHKGYEGALHAYERVRDDMLAEARREILVLATELARRVALRAVELDASVVERQLERVLGMAIEPTRVTLRVHPDDRPRVDEAMPGLIDRFAHSPHARTEDDASLERGSCVLRTDRGEIDASIGTMLDEITSRLLDDDAPGDDA